MSEPTPSRRCTRCGELKPLDEFLRRAAARSGRSSWCRSCFSVHRKLQRGEPKGHGLSKHPLYGIWNAMLWRCEHPEHEAYHRYGGRGIKVCDRWHDVRLFITDIEQAIGSRPDGMTLDRINNDGDYEPGNVRWSSQQQQARNRKDSPEQEMVNRQMVARHLAGETVAALARELGIHPSVMTRRIQRAMRHQSLP